MYVCVHVYVYVSVRVSLHVHAGEWGSYRHLDPCIAGTHDDKSRGCRMGLCSRTQRQTPCVVYLSHLWTDTRKRHACASSTCASSTHTHDGEYGACLGSTGLMWGCMKGVAHPHGPVHGLRGWHRWRLREVQSCSAYYALASWVSAAT